MPTILYKLLPRDSSRSSCLVFRSGPLVDGSSAINEGNFRDFIGKFMSSSSSSSGLSGCSSRLMGSASLETWLDWPLRSETSHIQKELVYKGSFTIVNIYVFIQSVRRGRGHDASVLILNVDLLLMLSPGGYD